MSKVIEWLIGVSGGDVAGTEAWSLRLTGIPENLWILLGLFVVFGLLGWLVVHCYRREGRAPVRVKRALSALRIVLLFLLFIIILQPSLVVRFIRKETTAVAVIVDDTISMRWEDRYPDVAHRVALAAVAGLPDRQLAGEDRPSRTDLVRRVLLREGGVLKRLAEDHPLVLFRFGVTSRDATTYIEPLGEIEDAASVERDSEEGDNRMAVVREAAKKLESGGYHTNLARAMREMLNRLEGRRLSAVVVVSDGQNTGAAKGGGRLSGARQMAQQRGIPVYTVSVGDPRPPRNIMVAQLQGPREARQKSRLSFTAFVTQRLMSRQTVDVALFQCRLGEDEWVDTGLSAQVELGGKEEETGPEDEHGLKEVMLTTEAPGEVGVYMYKARIEPLSEEMIATDNEASATVRITDQKLNVLFVSGDAGWEFQFLRNYLLKMSEHYAATIWQQNADASFNQDASTGMKRATLPGSRDELFKYDVILLYDPRPSEGMGEELLGMLEEFVGKHHGGICYIVGNKYTDKNLLPGGAFEPLADLLPVVLARQDSAIALQLEGVKEMSSVRLSPSGMGHPMMQLAARADENSRIWDVLPGTYRSRPVSRLKTLATALAVNAAPGRLTSDQQPEPVIAIQYYGKGRVLYMGFDSTWRWRNLEEAAHYERFWENALDFLGQGRLEKKRILITTNGEKFDAGADIRVRVEAYDRDFAPLRSKTLTLAMRSVGEEKGTEYVLETDKPGSYTGIIPADRVGMFEIDAVADDTGQADWMPEDVAVRRIEICLPQEEFRRPEADRDALIELAGSTERFVRLAEVESLADKIPAGVLTVPTEVAHPIWNTRFMLMLLGLLLLVEWVFRKLYHMM